MKEAAVSQDIKLVSEVLRLRYWQHVLNEDLKQKAFSIPIHLGFGHEAIAAAVGNMMDPSDQLVLSHRNITYNLVRAGSLRPLYEEYRLVPTAVAAGKLGSMNLANPDWGVVYSSSILGNNLSIACGLALGKQVLGTSGIVAVLTGDGAMEEGQFYESLVFAASHRLKVLFIVENNNMAMSSTIQQRRCAISLEQICAGVNIPFQRLAGNDVFDYARILQSVRTMVDNLTPVCIEVHLGALNQHAGPTPGWPTDPKNISIENGLIVERTSNDPVFVLQQKLGTTAIEELSKEIIAEGWEK
ncbi:MAG TPA: thiamine pyrophosphate-dependent enzyme [Terriglobia bacterium]|nr:thiamine pyrophosphate-dependent enzyme [Terriglobia bacterium]